MPTSSSAVAGVYVPRYTKTLNSQSQPVNDKNNFYTTQEVKTDVSKLDQIPSAAKKGVRGFFSSTVFKFLLIGIGACVAAVAVAVPVALIYSRNNSATTISTTTFTTATTTTATTTTTTTQTTSSTSTTTTKTTTSTTTTSTTTTSTTKTTTTTTTSTSTTTTKTTTSTTTTSTTTTTTTSTTTSSTTTTSTTKTTTTTTTTTTTVPPSTACVSSASAIYSNGQFLYSPTSQVYAAGMLNNQFGIYRAYGNGNVTSTTIWTASQTSTSQTAYLALQTDRNLVVYTSTGGVLWSPLVHNGGIGSPFCFQMLDSGNLIWTDNSGAIIWQTNTVQSG